MKTGVTTVPGRSFELMRWMTAERNRGGPFSTELLLAIFWDRSLFVNARQEDGAGFGRLEPAEIEALRLDAGMDVTAQSILLSDLLSVDAVIAHLRLLARRTGSVDAALAAFAGSEQVAGRWRSAAVALKRAAGAEEEIVRALSLARPFPTGEAARRSLRDRLFPHQEWLLSA